MKLNFLIEVGREYQPVRVYLWHETKPPHNNTIGRSEAEVKLGRKSFQRLRSANYIYIFIVVVRLHYIYNAVYTLAPRKKTPLLI